MTASRNAPEKPHQRRLKTPLLSEFDRPETNTRQRLKKTPSKKSRQKQKSREPI
ncbi:hypothetical protein GP5015_2507 [gamma proteobacterium HTCC5015]|nr:hypothetical protein GP5015_2507 [gamma proteobacterium HTCC5015]